MKKIIIASAMALLASASYAATGEFSQECAYGLSMGKHVATDCTVNEKIGGKTYCFSSAEAKSKFMADASGNMAKAEETYGRK